MKKNTKLHIPISSEQKEKLKERASILDMNLSDYCRIVLINSKFKVISEETLED